MYANMEFWSEIRRRVLTGEISKREACKQYEIHWITLKKILAHEEPPGYRRVQPPRRRTIEPVLPIIQQILKEDQTKPRKQRHTAKRIWDRLKAEHGFTGGCTVVRDAVRELKVGRREVFLPLDHPPGEAQVDYGFATVTLAGVETNVALFVMTLPYSGAVYLQAFPRECTETFLEGHVRAFAFFGGVPRRIAYDNTKVAVAKIVGSRERVVTKEFSRLKSYHLFDAHFCLVRRPNEKGHVERLLDYARSNFLVPVPAVASLAELNAKLNDQCRQDQERHVRGKPGTIAMCLAEDRSAFLGLPPRPFEARRVAPTTADSLSLATFDTNEYSVPTKYAYRPLTVIASVDEVKIVHEDQVVARHPRCWDRDQYRYDPIHYLAILERKPGGFDFARPLKDWHLPPCFDLLRRRLEADDRHGTRAFIRILRLLERHSLEQLTDAVEYALDLDVIDPESVRVILDYRADQPVELFPLDGHLHLHGVRVETTDVSAYRALLAEVTP